MRKIMKAFTVCVVINILSLSLYSCGEKSDNQTAALEKTGTNQASTSSAAAESTEAGEVSTSEADSQPENPSGEITGRLLTDTSSQPLSETKLVLFRKGESDPKDDKWFDLLDQKETKTDLDGKFTFENLVDGEYLLYYETPDKKMNALQKDSNTFIMKIENKGILDIGEIYIK